jgi:hypothetical protein
MEARRLSSDTEIPGAGATIGDFWAWAYSDLMINTTRGVFAEYLVGNALGVVDGVRGAWDTFDLLYKEVAIEVKTSAYIQRWPQEKPSTVNWGIEERFAYDVATNTWGEKQVRSADCYVFCLYAETDRELADVLDFHDLSRRRGKWEFYILSTERIHQELGTQKRVGLGRIKAMTKPVGYGLLKERVDQVLSGAA